MNPIRVRGHWTIFANTTCRGLVEQCLFTNRAEVTTPLAHEWHHQPNGLLIIDDYSRCRWPMHIFDSKPTITLSHFIYHNVFLIYWLLISTRFWPNNIICTYALFLALFMTYLTVYWFWCVVQDEYYIEKSLWFKYQWKLWLSVWEKWDVIYNLLWC